MKISVVNKEAEAMRDEMIANGHVPDEISVVGCSAQSDGLLYIAAHCRSCKAVFTWELEADWGPLTREEITPCEVIDHGDA